MKQATTLFLTATTLCISSVSGFPLFWAPKDLIPKRSPQPQSYSVVAVDGGTSVAPTKTVTDAVTQTILSTIIATPSDAEPTTSIAVQTVTISATIAASEASVTSVPFDDGQWKTTYYFRSTVAPQANAAVTSTSASAQPSSSGSSDPGQWSYWSGRSGNGQP